MAEVDFREISQQYAQGAIKAIILVNGASAIAVLSQMKGLSTLIPHWAIGLSIVLFVLGVSVGSGCWIVDFIATRYVDRTNRDQDLDYSISNKWMYIGEALLIFGVLLFASGSLLLAFTFMFA